MAFIYNPNTHYPIGDTAYKYGSDVKTIKLSQAHNRQIVITPEDGKNNDNIMPPTTIVVQSKEQSEFNVNF